VGFGGYHALFSVPVANALPVSRSETFLQHDTARGTYIRSMGAGELLTKNGNT